MLEALLELRQALAHHAHPGNATQLRRDLEAIARQLDAVHGF
jgi:hypothetical protein